MKLRKLITTLLIVVCTGFLTPVFAGDATGNPNTETPASNELTQQLTNRLIEIRKMDKSQLTSAERRQLRKEVKKIRDDRKRNGVYLSIGAIIIIALLLILLL
jgi:hypothetical protein